MLANKIRTAFNRDKNLRVLFFFDPQGADQETVERLSFEDIRVEIFNGCWLDYKIKFSREWKDDKVFFYFRQQSPRTDDKMLDFQLLDIYSANRELVLDNAEDFMTEYRLQPHQLPLVSKYKSELTRLTVIPVIKPLLNPAQFEEKAIQQGILSALFDFNKIESWETLIIRLLTYTLPGKQKNLNYVFSKLQKLPLLDELNRHLRPIFGTEITGEKEQEIADLLKRLKYNLITQGISVHDADPYKELKVNDPVCIQSMNLIYEAATRDKTMGKNFEQAFALHGKAIQMHKIVTLYGYDAGYVYLPEDLIWEILRKMLEVETTPSDVIKEKLHTIKLNLAENQRNSVLNNSISFLYDCVMLQSETTAIKSYIYDTPEDYIKQYKETLYLIDTYYRRAIVAHQKLNMQTTPIDEAINEWKKQMDKKYYDCTFRLNDEWLKCLQENQFDYRRIVCDKQYDFYEKKIAPLQQKVAVIISDALRYEVAVELLALLHADDKNVSTLSVQLASIPSTTKFGMANLLPAEKRVFKEGEILLNGEKTATTAQREKILKQRNENSRAVWFEQLTDNDKHQNRELFKSGVVYVYHDAIDKTGHKGVERDTFTAVQTAVGELSKLVKQIITGFNVAKVFITSDHGFLYNDFDIAETDKNEIEDTEILESDARHYITQDAAGLAIGYKIPLFKTTQYQEPYYVVIPDATNRFKKAGSRYRYTHGGGSLQELVIPVIECMRKEERVQRKVEAILATPDKDVRIVSNTLRLTIAQKTPVSATEKERTIEIGIYENDRLVSNAAVLRLNSSDQKPTNRMQNVSLILTNKTNSNILKLKVYDAEDKLNPLVEKNVKNNTLMERDF